MQTNEPKTGDTVDRIGTAATEDINRGGEFTSADTSTVNRVDDLTDDDARDDSPLRWLLPLILLGLLVAVGWAFCRKAEAPPATTTNANTTTNMNSANANTNAANR